MGVPIAHPEPPSGRGGSGGAGLCHAPRRAGAAGGTPPQSPLNYGAAGLHPRWLATSAVQVQPEQFARGGNSSGAILL
jgi:hypothetical protein